MDKSFLKFKMLTSSFSIAEKEAKKLVQKNSSVKQFLDKPPAQMLTTRRMPHGQHLGGRPDKNSMRKVNSEPLADGMVCFGLGFLVLFFFPKIFMPLGISLRRMQKEQCLVKQNFYYSVLNPNNQILLTLQALKIQIRF